MKKLELLAPAGSPEALRAAVQNGADAVYLGWGDFNARRSAKNFSDEEFEAALLYCHQRDVRVFLTLNTLLTDRELPQALTAAATACRLGVDAVLVQDWGLFAMLREALPDLPLHASTQMSLFTSGGARKAAELGCERVVIARECSAKETAAICANCPAEVEVFAHGALCMCYSGQCAMSALIGGRSGNRGRCAQPCRLPYGVNGKPDQYPLSLKDSCLAENLAEMSAMGVACLKIEGRMKRPEYVAIVTGIYARLLRENRRPTAAETAELEQVFSRDGFTDDYWWGKHGPDMFGVRPENAAEPKALFAAAKASYEKDTRRTLPVHFTCWVTADAPAILMAEDEEGHTVSVSGAVPEPARTRSLTADDLQERLQKTGGTAYHCTDVESTVEEGLSLSAGAINALRRDALAELSLLRTAPPSRRELPLSPLPDIDCSALDPQFTVSVMKVGQITDALMDCHPARVSLPLESFRDIPALPRGDTEWCVELPRIWRDDDEVDLRNWLGKAKALGVTGALLGNLGQIPLVDGFDFALYGDFGLNVFNSYSLEFLRNLGFASAAASFELRGVQLRDLQKVLPVEAIVYGRLPLMITENCLIQNSVGCRCDRPNFLNDRTGAAFPLLPMYGHRTEVENSTPLYLADRGAYKQLGLNYARLRFTVESPADCARIFRDYLDSAPVPEEFTRGLFDRGVE
ncbi:MAG: DUF3656 domain-containing protein [Oscillibacter sp.]